MNLSLRSYNFNRPYFMSYWNMKPRKKTTRTKKSVQWGVHKRIGKRIYKWMLLDLRRELDYHMIFRGHKVG